MRTRTVSILAVSLFLIASFGSLVVPVFAGECKAEMSREKSEEPKRPKAPTFTLDDHNGKPVKLADHRGKVVVLEFVNPDCPFVKAHYDPNVRTMPKLAEKYADDGVVWLAINATHYYGVEKNKAFHKKHDLPYPVLDGSAGDVGRRYGAKTTPHVYVIDRQGRIAYQGAVDDNPLGRKKSTTPYLANALAAITGGDEIATPKTKPYGCSVKYAPKKNFTLKNQNGKKVSLTDHAGRVTVLEWVNPDCPFVKRHYKAGTMEQLATKWRRKGVRWLAINSTHYFNVKKNKAFHKAHDLSYPVLDDSSGEVGRLYGAKTTPHLFIIAADGTVAYQGAIDNAPRGKKKDTVNHVDNALRSLTAGEDVETPKTRSYGCSVKYARKAKK
jgi:peroxiredoxin